MSKYYDKLLKINESLTRELKEKGIVAEEEDATVPVPADSLTDDQKKNILKDTLTDSGLKVDDKVVDELVKNPDEMAGVQKILGDEQKNESGAVQLDEEDDRQPDDEDKVYLRIDDDDLELHGYVGRGDKDLNIVQDEKDAVEYTRGDAETEITNLCEKHHYDPETFSLQDIGTQVPSDGENWISLDPMNPSATTTAQ